jgi:hypothetical protein
LKVKSPRDVTGKVLDSFLRRHLDKGGLAIAQLVVDAYPKDAAVVVDSGAIVGFASMTRLTSGTAAVSNLRTRLTGRTEASGLLLGEVVRRARETLHKHITCFARREGEPSPRSLMEAGFSHWLFRETFAGPVKSVVGTTFSEVRSQAKIAIILDGIPRDEALGVSFRAVPFDLGSLNALLSNGTILSDESTSATTAVLISDAVVLDEGRLYPIAGYLRKGLVAPTTLVGEVSLFGNPTGLHLVGAASDWLSRKGVSTLQVYLKPSKDVGRELAGAGFQYAGQQDAWKQDLVGPMDAFVQ